MNQFKLIVEILGAETDSRVSRVDILLSTSGLIKPIITQTAVWTPRVLVKASIERPKIKPRKISIALEVLNGSNSKKMR